MANFAPLKKEKVKRLVKYIHSMLLLVLSMMWMGQLEETESQETMPQEHPICTFEIERPITERTIAHLYSEQIAVPILTAGELPGYHPHHSKPKCLHIHLHKNRHANSLDKLHTIHQSQCYHHVIDYYIYTLEHILI